MEIVNRAKSFAIGKAQAASHLNKPKVAAVMCLTPKVLKLKTLVSLFNRGRWKNISCMRFAFSGNGCCTSDVMRVGERRGQPGVSVSSKRQCFPQWVTYLARWSQHRGLRRSLSACSKLWIQALRFSVTLPRLLSLCVMFRPRLARGSSKAASLAALLLASCARFRCTVSAADPLTGAWPPGVDIVNFCSVGGSVDRTTSHFQQIRPCLSSDAYRVSPSLHHNIRCMVFFPNKHWLSIFVVRFGSPLSRCIPKRLPESAPGSVQANVKLYESALEQIKKVLPPTSDGSITASERPPPRSA